METKDLRISINESLEKIERELKYIIKEAGEAYNNDEIIEIARAEVKTCLEHLRSPLDYIAQHLYDNYSELSKYGARNNKKGQKVFFPLGKDNKQFKKKMDIQYPSLEKVGNGLFSLFREIQRQRSDKYKWIIDLMLIVNPHKHHSLVGHQKRQNEDLYNIGNNAIVIGANSKNVTLRGNIINGVNTGNHFFEDMSKLPDKLSLNGVPMIKERYDVKFLFDKLELEIVPFIHDCKIQIKNFSQQYLDIVEKL